MPKIEIDNLIIFGDSMSDIGNKRVSNFGIIARALGLMRTNEIGRYSDSRNWTDFLWEWAGARSMVGANAQVTNENTLVHRSLTNDSSQDSGFGRPINYCNYAEGGAMGADDQSKIGLGTYKEQVLRYLKERNVFPLRGNTLHILWFGLNDLVTNNRNPDTMYNVVDALGNGMRCIDMHHSTSGEYFIVVNLPSPVGAVRMIKKNDLAAVAKLDKGSRLFNEQLNGLIEGHYYNEPERVSLVDIAKLSDAMGDHPEKFRLIDSAQPHGVSVCYPGKAPSVYANHVATSDNAHPTEAVYKVLAKEIVRVLLEKYDLGSLRSSRLL
jgi:phospholipase/lecithinase/hemolysin